MENASKALIIAGAILLSILLISLGIMVYNNAKGTISDANIDQETIQAFNTKISQYCGSGKNGTTMNSLMEAIAASNGAQKGKSDQHYISYDVSGASDGVTTAAGGTTPYTINVTSGSMASTVSYPTFDNEHTYKASYTTDSKGYINKVTVTIP